MSERKQELLAALERVYRDSGWKVASAEDGTLRATGPGGVTWIGLAVVAADLADSTFPERLLALADSWMPNGRELCPLDVLPDAACAAELREILADLRLTDRAHDEVYSTAA